MAGSISRRERDNNVVDLARRAVIDEELRLGNQGTGGSGPGISITRSISVVAVNTAAGAAALTDYVYICTGTITITLPTAVGNTNRYTVKNAGVATVSIASTGGQTFDGTASPITMVPGQSLDFISDNANWNIV